MKHMTANEIFEVITTFTTVSQLRDWMTSLGYDFNPDYTGLECEYDHHNYTKHANLGDLHYELDLVPNAKAVYAYNLDGLEIIFDDVYEIMHPEVYQTDTPRHTLINI
mgnify:CR=1 FL=1|tara:strand:- start:10 stop:333 length:324 start_codon:yes stop_codon:yes gene_type:complete